MIINALQRGGQKRSTTGMTFDNDKTKIMELKFDSTERAIEIAIKIFEHMALHQSCTISGFEWEGDDSFPKGEIVVKELIELDLHFNCKKGKRRRIRAENQIGDFVAQKAWKWAKRIVDDKIRYDIWRIQ